MQSAPPVSQGSGIFSKLLLVLLLVGGFYFYCDYTFPASLRSMTAQMFESHSPRDLTPDVLSQQTLKNSHLFNDPIIRLCQDVAVDSFTSQGEHYAHVYCVNQRSQVIRIDLPDNKATKLTKAQKGISYGTKLSNDKENLFFINSDLGLCQYNIIANQIISLVSTYKNEPLRALNSIQVDRRNSHMIYFTQTNPNISMNLFNIDIILNNPMGRLFEFNNQTKQLKVIVDGLYFPNGVVYQEYKGEGTLLVAETNRFRVWRVWIQGQKRGKRQILVDKLDVYLDNMKLNQNGDLWIAGPSPRDQLSYFADIHPWIRTVISRLPPAVTEIMANKKYFGGIKISFSKDNSVKQIEYFLWPQLSNFAFVTTVNQVDNKLYLSSLTHPGILVIHDWNKLYSEIRKSRELTNQQQQKEQL